MKAKKWESDGCRLFYRVNEDWNHIHLVFVAPGFAGGDYYANYAEVSDYLKKELQDVPGLFQTLGLVVMDEEQFQRGGIYDVGPEFADFADEFPENWSYHPSGSEKKEGC